MKTQMPAHRATELHISDALDSWDNGNSFRSTHSFEVPIILFQSDSKVLHKVWPTFHLKGPKTETEKEEWKHWKGDPGCVEKEVASNPKKNADGVG